MLKIDCCPWYEELRERLTNHDKLAAPGIIRDQVILWSQGDPISIYVRKWVLTNTSKYDIPQV